MPLKVGTETGDGGPAPTPTPLATALATGVLTPTATPTLTVRKLSEQSGGVVTGAVLLLHGGMPDSEQPVSPWSLPLARMRMFVAPLQTRTNASGVAVAMLRYRHRGWNGEAADAYKDAVWALDQLAERYGPVPIALVGHSMGARAAVLFG